MYSQKEINKVLKVYDQLKSINGTVRTLGYPARVILRQWIRERNATGKVTPKRGRGGTDPNLKKKVAKVYIQKGRNLSLALQQLGHTVTRRTIQEWVKASYPQARKLVNSPIRLRAKQYSWETKVKAVFAMRQPDRTVISVAREYDVCRQTLYAWDKEIPKPQLNRQEPVMSPPKREESAPVVPVQETTMNQRFEQASERLEFLEKQVTSLVLESKQLQEQIYRLQPQKDVLVEVAKILKKDEDGNPRTLSNREKAIVIDVLKKSFKLKDLLEALTLSKSSYFYQHAARERADKLREQILETFNQSYRSYGYRRIWAQPSPSRSANFREGCSAAHATRRVVRVLPKETEILLVLRRSLS